MFQKFNQTSEQVYQNSPSQIGFDFKRGKIYIYINIYTAEHIYSTYDQYEI